MFVRGLGKQYHPRLILPTTPVGPDTFVVTAFPEWLEPMAATLTQERFTGPDWIFERKFDGIRLLAFKHGGDVRLFSRNRLPQNNPAVSAAIAALAVRRRHPRRRGHVARRGRRVAYHVFDVLWLDGRDLTPLPLDERRALLRSLPLARPLQRVESLDDAHRGSARAAKAGRA